VTTVYIAGIYEYQAGATTKYYEGGALRRTGYSGDNGVFYALSDHLRSTSVLVNQNGTLNTNQYFYPYGGNRDGAFSSLTTKRFTGQYHEQSLPGGEGLAYYNARWYDAQVGVFVSADTIVPSPLAPQTLNRFAYAGGNPLRYTDPTGHAFDEGNVGGGGVPWWLLAGTPTPPAVVMTPAPQPVPTPPPSSLTGTPEPWIYGPSGTSTVHTAYSRPYNYGVDQSISKPVEIHVDMIVVEVTYKMSDKMGGRTTDASALLLTPSKVQVRLGNTVFAFENAGNVVATVQLPAWEGSNGTTSFGAFAVGQHFGVRGGPIVRSAVITTGANGNVRGTLQTDLLVEYRYDRMVPAVIGAYVFLSTGNSSLLQRYQPASAR